MNKGPKLIKKHDVRLLIHPGIMESGVYDAVFVVNGNIVEREFEVNVNATYDYRGNTNYSYLKSVVVSATCCNEDDEGVADIMERKLEEAIENYMWNKLTNKKNCNYGVQAKSKRKRIFRKNPDKVDTSMGRKYLEEGRVVILENRFYDNSNK